MMSIPRVLLSVSAAVLPALLFSGTASAQPMGPASPPPAPAGAAPAGRPVEFSAGLRGLVGGSALGKPTDIPGKYQLGSGYEGVGWAGTAGGFGWGFGAYAEARFVRYLGLELGLTRDSTNLHRDVTYNSRVKVRESVDLSTTRLDLMLKGVVPTPFGRVWLGLGPEFVVGASVDGKNEVTEGSEYLTPALRTQVEGLNRPTAEKPTYLAFGFGVVVHAGDLIEIPFELRAARNLSEESKWNDRVVFDEGASGGYVFGAQPSWDFRMGIGLGARF